MQKIFFVAILAGLCGSSSSWAWGIRGHISICEAAAKLVQQKELADFLNSKGSRIGYLCDVPDLEWRMMSQNHGEHRLNPENLGLTLQDIPLDYKTILQQFPGQEKVLGSNWWRGEQFYRRAAGLKSAFQDPLTRPSAALEFMFSLGYMGHFVADVSQPLHSTADYNGYAVGHGGIHMFYEEEVVDYISGSLPEKILEVAQSQNQFKQVLLINERVSVLEKIRALALVTETEKELILKLDPILKPSSQAHGLSLPAKRLSPAMAVQTYEPIILTQMARSAALLAHFWDNAYLEAGAPRFSVIPALPFPMIFTFVPPDYF